MDRVYYYYLLLFATFLFTISFLSILFEVIKRKITINIPYVALICMCISFIIYIFVSIYKKYYVHLLFYLIGYISVFIILFFKKDYDKKIENIMINKSK